MNRWYQIRRLRGAVILIVIGVLALLHQWNILHWGTIWPLFLIVIGLLMLVERVAWAADARAQQEAGVDAAGSASWPPATGSSNVGSGTFVQAHPSTPEDPGREGR